MRRIACWIGGGILFGRWTSRNEITLDSNWDWIEVRWGEEMMERDRDTGRVWGGEESWIWM